MCMCNWIKRVWWIWCRNAFELSLSRKLCETFLPNFPEPRPQIALPIRFSAFYHFTLEREKKPELPHARRIDAWIICADLNMQFNRWVFFAPGAFITLSALCCIHRSENHQQRVPEHDRAIAFSQFRFGYIVWARSRISMHFMIKSASYACLAELMCHYGNERFSLESSKRCSNRQHFPNADQIAPHCRLNGL